MGKLQEMLDAQSVFQVRVGYDISNMSTEECTAYIKEYSLHMTQELHEMLHELPFFKPWKDYTDMTFGEVVMRQSRAREEYIDVLHFMLNIALALGLTEDDIFQAFVKKHAINNKRQDGGY